MKTHTPGPWKVSHDDHEPYWNIDMPCSDGSYGFCNAMVYTTEEDARLVAAAPELLEVLRDVARFEKVVDGMNPSVWPKLHAAIAKAEGRGE